MSLKFQDYYATLGLEKGATQDEIKKAFRKLALKYHPDVAKDKTSAEEKFKEINEANEVLSDPVKRKKYDELGANWEQEPAPDPRRHSSNQANGHHEEFHFGGTGFSDFFEQMFARGNNENHGPFGTSNGSERASDIEGDLLVTLDEILNGAVREISLESRDPRTNQAKNHHFKVRIPAGIQEGQRIRVPGKGGLGKGGQGDLYLRVKLAAHPFFHVRGSDVYFDLILTPWEAVLGHAVKVPTLGGQITVRIAPGTNNGRQLRVADQGLPKGKTGERGDLFIVVEIQVPRETNPEQKALWEKLSQVSDFDPRNEQHL